MTQDAKYASVAALGSLELLVNADEQLFGSSTALTVIQTFTVVTYDDASFPVVSSLKLVEAPGGTAPAAPVGTTFLFLGKALVGGATKDVAAFRAG